MSTNKILVLGGDMRLSYVYERLLSSGHSVSRAKGENCDCIDMQVTARDIQNADIIILGVPATKDDLTINAPLCDTTLSLDDFFLNVPSYATVFGGMLSEKFKLRAKASGVRVVDYFDREELQILNAVPTSEGAIEIAMQKLPITLHGARCLVIGYGRIGKILCRQLYGLGANVTATSRTCEGLALIKSSNLAAINTTQLHDLSGFDAVFNTAAHRIVTEPLLKTLSHDAVLIDLASKPGGVDFDAAKKLSKNVVWALSLPGKCAPVSAGNIICDTILNILKETGQIL